MGCPTSCSLFTLVGGFHDSIALCTDEGSDEGSDEIATACNAHTGEARSVLG